MANPRIRAGDVDFLHRCLDRLITLAKTKARKACSAAGAFYHIGMAMNRYETIPSSCSNAAKRWPCCQRRPRVDQDESWRCLHQLVLSLKSRWHPR